MRIWRSGVSYAIFTSLALLRLEQKEKAYRRFLFAVAVI
jgi:hypothetical protein